MDLREHIKTAKTPQEALLMLAEAVDNLRAVVAVLPSTPADPWSQPLQWSAAPATLLPETRGPIESDDHHARKIAAIQTLLDEATDPDDIQALQARLKLARDAAGEKVYERDSGGGGVMKASVPEGQRVVESEGYVAGSPTQKITVGGNEVVIPLVSKERQLARRTWANEHKLWEFIPLDETAACIAYAKGGPLWLYLGNRDAVMQMPFEWRQEMIADIEQDSPAQAQEVGRDILKQTESADRAITVSAVEALSASRGL